MFSNKNMHRKESASPAHDLTGMEAAGSDSRTAVTNKKKVPAWVIIPILAVIILLAWILSVFAGGKIEDSAGTPLNVVKAERGTVKEVYNSTGTIESENTKTYYSPVAAPIKECRAVAGQTVKAGDLLVTFDTTNLERDNQQAQLTLQSSLNSSIAARTQNARAIDAANAASAQAAAQANALADEVNALVSQVDSAYAQYQANQQAAAQQAAQNAPKVQELQSQITTYNESIASADAVISFYERGYTGRQVEINEALAAENPDPVQEQIIKDTEEYNAALKSKSDTEALLAQAQDSLDALGVPPADDAGYSDLLAQYEAKYTEWQAAYQAAGASVPDTGMTSAELSNLDISDNLAELAALTPEELLAKGKEGMKADMNGVVASVEILQTNSAAQGTALFTIADTDNVRVKIEVAPDDYDKMNPGSEVDVTLAGHTYKGTLTGVDKIAVPNAKGVPVIGARIHIENPDENICIGATAKIKMTVAEAENVVVIPTEAINASTDGDFVYVIENGIVKEKPVTLGISSSTQTEITEGLDEGDIVINDFNADIRPGMRAAAKESAAE